MGGAISPNKYNELLVETRSYNSLFFLSLLYIVYIAFIAFTVGLYIIMPFKLYINSECILCLYIDIRG